VVLPTDTRATTCPSDFGAVKAAELTQFNDTTTRGNNYRGTRVDRGSLLSTYRSDRTAAVNAYNAYETARRQRPHLIRAQQAQVANALVAVGTGVGNLENAYVYAPVDGTITAINGTVGEYLQGGTNLTPATPLAPGGTAKIPTTGDLAGVDQKSLTGGQGPNLGLQNVLPAGNTFIQMATLNDFSVVAAFNQNDAALVNAGSAAKVAIDALPGKSIDGTVTAVAPIATTAANGVPMYYATVLLNKDQVPPALKSGLSGNVSVVTSTIENKALVVPTSAVTRDEDQSYVQVPGPDGKPAKKMFTAGKVGDDNTQVINGLKPGETVYVPDSGPLPVPAEGKAPTGVSTSTTVVIDHPKKPPVTPADSANPAAAPAPADGPVADSGTYPGDPGANPDAGGPSGGPGAQNTGAGGVNPFATPIKPTAATPAN
jgi:HlyD family secretion protein